MVVKQRYNRHRSYSRATANCLLGSAARAFARRLVRDPAIVNRCNQRLHFAIYRSAHAVGDIESAAEYLVTLDRPPTTEDE